VVLKKAKTSYLGVHIPAFCPIVSRFAATKKIYVLGIREYTVP